MTEEFNLEYGDKDKPEKSSAPKEGRKKEQDQALGNQESLAKSDSNRLRKAALSKREIMEELSRARFPWEE